MIRLFISAFIGLNLVNCSIDAKNRVAIEGGTFRIMTYAMHEGGIKTIELAEENDTLLGIGISFDITFFSDGTENTGIVNTYTQGDEGVSDTISTVKIINSESGSEIQDSFFGSKTESNFRMSQNEMLPNIDYLYALGTTDYYSAFSFVDFNEFSQKYNDRDGDFIYRDNLEREFFFWLPTDSQISYEELEKIDFRITFTNGKIIKLTRSSQDPR